jgi:hypothetical protein
MCPLFIAISFSSWISMLRSMTHQEFRALLRTVLQSFLNCIEGLQTLNDNITELTKGTRFVVKAYITTGCSFIL